MRKLLLFLCFKLNVAFNIPLLNGCDLINNNKIDLSKYFDSSTNIKIKLHHLPSFEELYQDIKKYFCDFYNTNNKYLKLKTKDLNKNKYFIFKIKDQENNFYSPSNKAIDLFKRYSLELRINYSNKFFKYNDSFKKESQYFVFEKKLNLIVSQLIDLEKKEFKSKEIFIIDAVSVNLLKKYYYENILFENYFKRYLALNKHLNTMDKKNKKIFKKKLLRKFISQFENIEIFVYLNQNNLSFKKLKNNIHFLALQTPTILNASYLLKIIITNEHKYLLPKQYFQEIVIKP